MLLGIDPKVDYAFKYLFGRERNRPLLLLLLNAILRPQEPLAELELLNPFNEKDFEDDKLSILDIKAKDRLGRLFNIEMQLLATRAFRERLLYYGAKLYQGQLQEGMAYQQLRPTTVICFLNAVLFAEVADHHLIFEWRERQHGLVLSDQLAIHLLELPKFTKAAAELATPLDRWLYFLRHAEQFDPSALPAGLDSPEMQGAVGELTMLAQNAADRERYESRLKFQRDYDSALADARQVGLQEGQAGERMERIHDYQQLLGRPLTPLEQLRQMPADKLEQLVKQLKDDLARSLSRSP